ncbi:antA/AntB antirepressor family protein [Acinetobacter indicus]|uniref:antA/AntB antirepressor family protein n=1 Tax=Acinetobacter indicus TaxID=756892 RepID=UPI0032B51501
MATNTLVPTFQGFLANKTQTLVNARDLHHFLGSKKDFSSWMKSRINEYKFKEEQDYFRLTQKVEANNATMIEYHISLDMAKELSMVERTERGRQARQYFIAMEQKAITSHNNLAELNSRLKDGIFSNNLRYRQMYRYLQKELTILKSPVACRSQHVKCVLCTVKCVIWNYCQAKKFLY